MPNNDPQTEAPTRARASGFGTYLVIARLLSIGSFRRDRPQIPSLGLPRPAMNVPNISLPAFAFTDPERHVSSINILISSQKQVQSLLVQAEPSPTRLSSSSLTAMFPLHPSKCTTECCTRSSGKPSATGTCTVWPQLWRECYLNYIAWPCQASSGQAGVSGSMHCCTDATDHALDCGKNTTSTAVAVPTSDLLVSGPLRFAKHRNAIVDLVNIAVLPVYLQEASLTSTSHGHLTKVNDSSTVVKSGKGNKTSTLTGAPKKEAPRVPSATAEGASTDLQSQ
ncbi:hypothetical protein BJ508DRAFT_310035 [Ascobolus immersus RN42]|uniref:Uncharacterized protein n=1 Tax=Ascobolus immersus RN42 TaxID=1160509 RepID=A0A3N4HWK2_ASCIM|nr:hypothetical protein BJ508DRAFT_310035 [Ascobolus immersus RN42]